MRSPRLLLINPSTGPSFWGLDHAMDLWEGKYSNAPLGLMTIAALTPDHWQVELVDENVSTLDLDTPCDVVGIGAMNVQSSRALELAAAFRKRGRLVVMGGPHPSLQPERFQPHADVVMVGEAERTWPSFCADFERGQQRGRYVEREQVDLALSPVPRFDLVHALDYASLPVQTSRGCPHDCEFCDVLILNGRRVRTKPRHQVLAEVKAIRDNGGDSIFFTDDNFVGNRKYVRSLLEGLVQLNVEGDVPLYFFTQASLDLAEQPDLLDLMSRAGFTRVFIGVETPRRQNLVDAGKRANVRGNLLQRIQTIQSAGLMIWAGMIVGMDNDDPSIFAEQAEFLDEAGIPVAMVGMLNAPPDTRLYHRLEAEGRLYLEETDWADNCAWTNIIPRAMTRQQLFAGYAELLQEIYRPEAYARRVMTNVWQMDRGARSLSASTRLPSRSELTALWRAIHTYTFSRDPARRRHFLPNVLKVIALRPERMVEAAIHLAMWRHFETYVPNLVTELRRVAAAELIPRKAA